MLCFNQRKGNKDMNKQILQTVDVGILVFFLIVALLISITHGNLSPYEQLEKDVESTPYTEVSKGTGGYGKGDKGSYKMGVFDCSNMAAIMVEHLDAKGYNAEIVVVKRKKGRIHHAFVIVDREAIIEPTHKLITFTEGKYGDKGSTLWYRKTWEVVGVYGDKEDAAKQSRWGVWEWYSAKRK